MKTFVRGMAMLLCGTTCACQSPTRPKSTTIPEPMPTSGTIVWQDTFDQTPGADALLTTYTHLDRESRVTLDPSGGLAGSPAVRIDWPAQANTNRNAGGCQDDDHLIERGFAAATELYVQFSVRYTPGFQFDWRTAESSGTAGSCDGNAKKLFLIPGGPGVRLDLISENHHIVLYEDAVGYASGLQNVGREFTPEQLGDGQWHRVTIHVRQASAAGAADGFIYGWIDGELKWSQRTAVHSAGYAYFQTPTVFNNGSPVAQTEWLDNLTVWKP